MNQQASGFKPKASFYLFSLSTCGHCKHFKGETTDKDGNVHVSSNGAWEVLRKDKDLYNAGVQFVLYQVGNVKNEKTGQVEKFELEDKWKYIRGFPHLAMEAYGGKAPAFNFDRNPKSWNAEDAVPVIKKWILDTLASQKFKVSASGQASETSPTESPTPVANFNPNNQGVPDVSYTAPAPVQGPRVPSVVIPGQAQVSQGSVAQQRATQQAVISQQSGRNPTVFGMGTRQVPVPTPEYGAVTQPPVVVKKAPTRYLPSNYNME